MLHQDGTWLNPPDRFLHVDLILKADDPSFHLVGRLLGPRSFGKSTYLVSGPYFYALPKLFLPSASQTMETEAAF